MLFSSYEVLARTIECNSGHLPAILLPGQSEEKYLKFFIKKYIVVKDNTTKTLQKQSRTKQNKQTTKNPQQPGLLLTSILRGYTENFKERTAFYFSLSSTVQELALSS